jgi:hypothetical protein
MKTTIATTLSTGQEVLHSTTTKDSSSCKKGGGRGGSDSSSPQTKTNTVDKTRNTNINNSHRHHRKDDRRSGCGCLTSIPCYGLIFFILCFVAYSATTAIFLPTSSSSSSAETSDFIMNFAMDLGVCAFTAFLATHIWWVTRNETSTMAFGSVALGWLNKAFVSEFIETSTTNTTSTTDTNAFSAVDTALISMTVTYALWTIATFFLTVTVYEAWKRRLGRGRNSRSGRRWFWALLQARFAFLFLVISMAVITAGCVISTTSSSSSSTVSTPVTMTVFEIGLTAWHVSAALFVLSGAYVWGSLANERTVTMWGLRNNRAGPMLVAASVITMALQATASFVLQQYNIYLDYTIYFGAALSVYLIHNVLFSIFCPPQDKKSNEENLNETESSSSESHTNGARSVPAVRQTDSEMQGIESDIFYRDFLYFSAFFSNRSQEMMALASKTADVQIEGEDITERAPAGDIEDQISAQKHESVANFNTDQSMKDQVPEGMMEWLCSLIAQPQDPIIEDKNPHEQHLNVASTLDNAGEMPPHVDALPICPGLIDLAVREQSDEMDFDDMDLTHTATEEEVPDVLEIAKPDGIVTAASALTLSTYAHSTITSFTEGINSERALARGKGGSDLKTNPSGQQAIEMTFSMSKRAVAKEDTASKGIPRGNLELQHGTESRSFEESIRVEDASKDASSDEIRQRVQVSIRPKDDAKRNDETIEMGDNGFEKLRLRSLATRWRQKASIDKRKRSARSGNETSLNKEKDPEKPTNESNEPDGVKYVAENSRTVPVSEVEVNQVDPTKVCEVPDHKNDDDQLDQQQESCTLGISQVQIVHLPAYNEESTKKKKKSKKKRAKAKSCKSKTSSRRRLRDGDNDDLSLPSCVHTWEQHEEDDNVSQFGTDTESVVSAWQRSQRKIKRKSKSKDKTKNKSKNDDIPACDSNGVKELVNEHDRRDDAQDPEDPGSDDSASEDESVNSSSDESEVADRESPASSLWNGVFSGKDDKKGELKKTDEHFRSNLAKSKKSGDDTELVVTESSSSPSTPAARHPSTSKYWQLNQMSQPPQRALTTISEGPGEKSSHSDGSKESPASPRQEVGATH